VSVQKSKCHTRKIFVSDIPPSAVNLSLAIIFLQGMGLFKPFGHAATSIAKKITAF
jgi:hypothetical protein